MGISVALSETSRTPEQERTAAHMSRSRSGGALGEEEELQKLFEELMGGDSLDSEELKDFDWEGLWNSLMGDEATGGGQDTVQGSQSPTMFGNPIRPATGNAQGGRPNSYW